MTNYYLLKSIDYESVETAMLGLLTQRKRIYPAHYLAMELVADILLPLAGHDFILTISHIQERMDVTERIARTALQKLIDSGVIIETSPYRIDPKTGVRLARRFKVGASFFAAVKPSNHWEGVIAFRSAGGTQEQYSTVKRMLAKANPRVTVTEVLDELARLNADRSKAQRVAYKFGGPAGLGKVI
ncbi:hypothetical protein M3672_14975 [Microbacterium enclense]|uniref:hypothetical protein n=1 Tax=Microbacterium enclense TaxID=993073 RepID=UPI00203D7C31|nr:hypothetical protein [Microbacterium enclense]MCM3615733.1 hypothetical protein [Microbacterium enclense]